MAYVEAKGRGHKAAKKELHHIEIHHAENGGHIVQHHYSSEGGAYHEPEHHAFGEGEGHKMLAHVAEHMGVEHESPAEDAAEGEEE